MTEERTYTAQEKALATDRFIFWLNGFLDGQETWNDTLDTIQTELRKTIKVVEAPTTQAHFPFMPPPFTPPYNPIEPMYTTTCETKGA